MGMLTVDQPLEPSPCDGCTFNTSCRDQKLACHRFESFYRFGGKRWRQAPRVPSAEIYGRVFKDDATVGRPRKAAAVDEKAARLEAFLIS